MTVILICSRIFYNAIFMTTLHASASNLRRDFCQKVSGFDGKLINVKHVSVLYCKQRKMLINYIDVFTFECSTCIGNGFT